MKEVETPHIDLKESRTSEPSYHCHSCDRTWDKRHPMSKKYDLRINMPWRLKEGVIDFESIFGFSFWHYSMCIDCLRIKTRFMIDVLTCLNSHIKPDGVDWVKFPDALKSLPYKNKPAEVVPYD